MELSRMLRKIEIKRAMRILPQYFLGTLALSLLIALLALCGTLVGKKENDQSKAAIALVLNDNVELSTLGMEILDNAKSTSALCSFFVVSEEEAMNGMADGTYNGAVIFPDRFVDDVNSEKGVTAQVYVPEFGNSFNDAGLRGLAGAGGMLLTAAETAFTGVRSYCIRYDTEKAVRSQLVDEVSALIAEYTLSREEVFVKDTASGTGATTAVQYYFCAAIVLLLLLGGISCGPLLKGDTKAYRDQLIHHRIGPVRQLLTKYLAALALFSVLYAFIFAALGGFLLAAPKLFASLFQLESLRELLVWFLSGLPGLLLAAAIVVFVYAFAANQIGGILLLFLVSILMGYASGCLAPSAFLPGTLREIGEALPTALMFSMLRNGARQTVSWELLLLMGVHIVFWLGLSCGVTKLKAAWDAH